MIGVSVIICTFNGENKIQPTLKALINQETKYPWELIFVDNNSSDDTIKVATEVLKSSKIDYRIESCSISGKMNAFWLGMRLSKYDYILDCDDDNHLFQDYLEVGIGYFSINNDVGALGGHGLVIGQDYPKWFNKYKKSYAVGAQGEPYHKYFNNHSLYGAGCFYRKLVLFELQKEGFNFLMSCRKGETLSSGGDIELCHLLFLSGFAIVYHPELKFYHDIPKNRVSWDYYIKLKKGITSGAGLLFAYEFYFKSKSKNNILYLSAYSIELSKAYLLCLKYKLFWKKKSNSEPDILALEILKSKFQSFFSNLRISFTHFKQLKKYFG